MPLHKDNFHCQLTKDNSTFDRQSEIERDCLFTDVHELSVGQLMDVVKILREEIYLMNLDIQKKEKDCCNNCGNPLEVGCNYFNECKCSDKPNESNDLNKEEECNCEGCYRCGACVKYCECEKEEKEESNESNDLNEIDALKDEIKNLQNDRDMFYTVIYDTHKMLEILHGVALKAENYQLTSNLRILLTALETQINKEDLE